MIDKPVTLPETAGGAEVRDIDKMKEQLIAELQALRARVAQAERGGGAERGMRRVEMLVDLVGAGIMITDAAGIIADWDRGAERLFGYTAAEVVGRPLALLLPQDRLNEPHEVTQRLDRGEEIVRLETERIAKDGRVIPVEVSLALAIDDCGQPSGLTAVVLDRSERRRVAEALRESERWLNEAQALAQLGHWTLDVATQEVNGSDELFRIFGLGRDAATLDAFAAVVHPEDREYDLYHIRRGMLTGEPWDIVHRLVTPSGAEKTIRAKGEAILGENGKPRLLMGTVQDITAQKLLEERLTQTQKMEAVGTLAGGVAHDMNNVLAVVLGLGTLLAANRAPDDPDMAPIRDIVASARRGKGLVENLIRFARKGTATRRLAAINTTVDEVVNVLAHSLPKKVTVTATLDKDLPAIECDASQLAQTLMNLCVNAGDALDGEGTIVVRTDQQVLRANNDVGLNPGAYVRVAVQDDGCGMDEQTRTRACEPFFTTKEVGKGTGLGLAIAYGVVRNHGGYLRIDSQPGHGTTVTVLLPAAQNDAEPQVDVDAVPADEDTVSVRDVDNPRVEQPRTADVGEDVPARARLLLVDDEEMIRSASKRMLEAMGYHVTTADGALAALQIYRLDPGAIDLVILDLSMPTMDGAECFAQLKTINPSVRVLVCTGHGARDVAESLVAAGARAVLNKPLALDEMAAALTAALEE